MSGTTGISNEKLAQDAKSLIIKSSPGIKEETVNEIVKNLTASSAHVKFLAGVIADPQSVPTGMVTTMAIAGWQNECDGNSQVGCVVFFMTARLSVGSPLNREGASKNRGLYTPGFQTTWGKYGYNDVNVQAGDVTTMVSCQGVACQITVFKNNQPIGFYVGGGVGTVAGTGGGVMSW